MLMVVVVEDGKLLWITLAAASSLPSPVERYILLPTPLFNFLFNLGHLLKLKLFVLILVLIHAMSLTG
jgi:hypothetical protein